MLKSSPNEITDSDNSVLLIPEIGLAHYGNLQLALNYVDLVSSLGLKTVKFQHHLSRYESSPSEQFRVEHRHFPYSSRFEYWDKMSLSEHEWIYLYNYVLSKDLSFSISPNSLQSAVFIYDNIAPSFWKLGSGDFLNYQLLDFLVHTDIPIVLSTGLCSSSDISSLLARYSSFDKFTFLSCISSYPSELIDFSIDRIHQLSSLVTPFNVGLSDHSSSIAPILFSYSNGIRIFEFHLSLSDHLYSFDSSSSLVPSQVQQLLLLLSHYRDIMSPSKLLKSTLSESNPNVARLFSKVVCSNKLLQIGDTITRDDLCMLRGFHDPESIAMSDFEICLDRRVVSEINPYQPVLLSCLS